MASILRNSSQLKNHIKILIILPKFLESPKNVILHSSKKNAIIPFCKSCGGEVKGMKHLPMVEKLTAHSASDTMSDTVGSQHFRGDVQPFYPVRKPYMPIRINE